jgi:hypothetical protein
LYEIPKTSRLATLSTLPLSDISKTSSVLVDSLSAHEEVCGDILKQDLARSLGAYLSPSLPLSILRYAFKQFATLNRKDW